MRSVKSCACPLTQQGRNARFDYEPIFDRSEFNGCRWTETWAGAIKSRLYRSAEFNDCKGVFDALADQKCSRILDVVYASRLDADVLLYPLKQTPMGSLYTSAKCQEAAFALSIQRSDLLSLTLA
jgi:hypothetical protein